MIMHDHDQQAAILAAQPYVLFAFLDQTTDGDTIYVATNPELPGCMAQGDTMEEAEEILAEVRHDFIAHCLTHNLPVPAPQTIQPVVSSDTTEPYARIIEPEADQDERTTDINLQVAFSA